MPAPGGYQTILLNSVFGRREPLPDRDVIFLYLDVNEDDNSVLAQRIRLTAQLLTRLLKHEAQTVRQVSTPEESQLAISGGRPAGTKFVLKVAQTIEVDSPAPGSFTKAEAEYLLLSAPHSLGVQWSSGALEGARAALGRLKEYLARVKPENPQSASNQAKKWRNDFYGQLQDDLNTPRALAVLWTMLQSELSNSDKYALLTDFCQTLGLGKALGIEEPKPAQAANRQATPAKNAKQAAPAKPGKDKKEKPGQNERRQVASSREVWSRQNEADRYDFAVSIIGYAELAPLKATLDSILHYVTRSSLKIEVIAADMNQSEDISGYLEFMSQTYANFHTVFCKENLGEAAGRNIALRYSRAKYILAVETGLTFSGDVFAALEQLVETETEITLYGITALQVVKKGIEVSGYQTQKLAEEADEPIEVEALSENFLVIPRRALEEVGFMDEGFKQPYALGLDYSYNFRDKGYKVKAVAQLGKLVKPAVKPAPPQLAADQLEKQQQKNWKLFLQSWDF